MSKKPPIWELVDVQVKNIKFNPDNPKIPNEKGLERLRKSLEKFGHIFDGIINSDFSLIDGHSRIAQLDEDDYAAVFINIMGRSVLPVMMANIAHQIYLQWLSKI